jgi:hypothetical protein
MILPHGVSSGYDPVAVCRSEIDSFGYHKNELLDRVNICQLKKTAWCYLIFYIHFENIDNIYGIKQVITLKQDNGCALYLHLGWYVNLN